MQTEITERARAIAEEAWRRWGSHLGVAGKEVSALAAQLALDDWESVDPDLEAVREIVAKVYEAINCHNTAARVRAGLEDQLIAVGAALAAYKAGRAAREAGK